MSGARTEPLSLQYGIPLTKQLNHAIPLTRSLARSLALALSLSLSGARNEPLSHQHSVLYVLVDMLHWHKIAPPHLLGGVNPKP
jgi:hypothetical protein